MRLDILAICVQHAKENIRCNSVHPGPIDTDMIRDTLSDPVLRDERLNRVPLGRIGKPEDIAYCVLYLASDESSFVTGSELVIDGGSTDQ
jgi:NAD(P)-dependent dehydrogenase (short-subunit alcohol dehydrogenase family)